MAWFDEDKTNVNFMLLGNVYSGAGLMQHCLNQHLSVICHSDLLHKDEKVRKLAHENYFGDCGQAFDWFIPTQISAEQYLANKIFDNNLKEEKAIGMALNYEDIVTYDLWQFIDQMGRIGDFFLIHVVRNPIACYVAKALANTDKRTVMLDEQKLIKFVRSHAAYQLKIDALCEDKVVIDYTELIMDYTTVMTNLLTFMEIDQAVVTPKLSVIKPDIRSRISNLALLRTKLPPDVLEYLNAPTLF